MNRITQVVARTSSIHQEAVAALDEFEKAVDGAEQGSEAERAESRADIVLCANEFETLAVDGGITTTQRMRAASLIQRARAMVSA